MKSSIVEYVIVVCIAGKHYVCGPFPSKKEAADYDGLVYHHSAKLQVVELHRPHTEQEQ
jgi:hypothetical protein